MKLSNMTNWRGILCGIVILAVAMLDFNTYAFNAAIVYALPLALSSQLRRRPPWALTILMVALTYAGYFLGPWPPDKTWETMILSPALLNRSMVAAVLVAITLMSSVLDNFRQRLNEKRYAYSEPVEEFFTAIDSLVLGIFFPVLLIFAVALTDALTPTKFNLPILYAVPLLVCSWSHSRRLLWIITVMSLVFAVMGLQLGFIHDDVVPTQSILNNRALSATLIFALGVALHLWIGNQKAPIDQDFAADI
jgi:hypothetical protein